MYFKLQTNAVIKIGRSFKSASTILISEINLCQKSVYEALKNMMTIFLAVFWQQMQLCVCVCLEDSYDISSDLPRNLFCLPSP